MSRRGKLDQRQKGRRAGLDRFALLVLAGQPCQPQLVMDPHQRIRLRSLIVIGHDELCGAETSPSDAAAPKTRRRHANPAA